MRRVLVTGNAGSGKSTVAAAMARILNLPYSGMDQIVWQPGWIKTVPAERNAKEIAIAKSPAWLVDGVSSVLVDAADTVVFLDFPRYKCYWRALRRNLPYLFKSRPGLPARCPELLVIPTLTKLIWRFPTKVRPQILAARRLLGENFVHIRNNSELRQFLATVRASGPNPSVNPDAPVRIFNSANACGGAPVTLIR
jgi:adenylate kinase family enzyme